jgi:serine/threonine protein kinase
MIGEQLSHYSILGNIGSGGMGEVYLARDELLDRNVALKLLPARVTADAGQLSRFAPEAKILASLNHPNIVTIHSVEEFEGRHFLAMELVDGQQMDVLIPEGGFALDEFLSMALPLTEAVSAAHGKGIVHRDLKPANIMVLGPDLEQLRVKLLDFGVAKFLGDSGQLVQTAKGMPIGTPEYMAPEQIRGEQTDHRADIYALGGILFFLLTGRPVFEGSGVAKTLQRQVSEPPRRPSELLAGADAIPPALDELVLACLVKDPALRIQSMAELARLLRQVRDGEASQTLAPWTVAPTPRSRATRWIGLGTIALTLVAAAVLGITLGWPAAPKASRQTPSIARSLSAAPASSPAKRPVAQRIRLESLPAGAAVIRQSDGVHLGRAPLLVEAPKPGLSERYVLRLPGHQSTTTRVDHRTRGVLTVQLLTAPLPPARPAVATPAVYRPSRRSARAASHRARRPRPSRARARSRNARRRHQRAPSSLRDDDVLNPF